MRILITGATGCVGRAVVARVREEGWEARGLTRTPAAVDGLDLRLGAVEHDDAVARAVDGCQAVVHLAGWAHRVPRTGADVAELRRGIVDGTRVVATRARAASARLVVASTVAVYGAAPDGPCTEATPPRPDTPYARAKLEAEEIVRAIDPGAAILRIALVFGPHDRGNVAALLGAVDRLPVPLVVGDGRNRKSIVYAGNLADRIVGLLTSPIAGVFIAADGAPTQRELVALCAAALGRRAPVRVPAAPLAAAGALLDLAARAARRPPRWRDRVRKLAASTEFSGAALDARLGYHPRVPLAEAIRRAADWTREAGRA